MKKLLYVLILCTCSQAALAENISDGKKVLIDKLLMQMGQSATDTGKLFSDLFIEQITTALKQSKPSVDPRALEIVEQETKQIIDEIFLEENSLAKVMYPIYGSRFTEGELEELVAFYETPLGKKLIKALPAITQEGMQAGQQLGKSLGPKIQQRIQARLNDEGIEM